MRRKFRRKTDVITLVSFIATFGGAIVIFDRLHEAYVTHKELDIILLKKEKELLEARINSEDE